MPGAAEASGYVWYPLFQGLMAEGTMPPPPTKEERAVASPSPPAALDRGSRTPTAPPHEAFLPSTLWDPGSERQGSETCVWPGHSV